MKQVFLLSTCLLLFSYFISGAQEADTVGKSWVDKNYQSIVSYTVGDDELTEYSIDTTLANVHYPDPADRVNFYYRNIGVLGGAIIPLVYFPETDFGLKLGYSRFHLYRFTNDKLRFFNNRRGPYTHIYFLIGFRKEQTFDITHSQNIGKHFNFTFYYKRFATDGDYDNQHVRHNDIGFSTRFTSKNQLYRLKTITIFNNIRSEENGGIKDPGIFSGDTSFITHGLTGVELDGAENKRWDIYFTVKQSWRRGKKLYKIINDTTVVQRFYPTFTIDHSAFVGREKFEYFDASPDSSYYGLFYQSDSAYQADFRSNTKRFFTGSELGFQKSFIKSIDSAGAEYRNILLNVSANYTYNRLLQNDSLNEAIHDLQLKASVESHPQMDRSFSYQGIFWYSLLDYTKHDLMVQGALSYDFKKFGMVKAFTGFHRYQPAWIFHRYEFGSVSWINDFQKTATYHVGLEYSIPRFNFHISARLNNIKNLTYWNEQKLPAQHGGDVQVVVFELRKLFKFSYFGFDNILRVHLISRDRFIRYPLYLGHHTLYFEKFLFKGSLLARIGIDIWYNTNFSAYGYFPLTQQLYLQNDQEQYYYPVLDFYFALKIKTMDIFFRMKHLNQGMFRKGYFEAYKYPAADRAFKLGLSWRFYN